MIDKDKNDNIMAKQASKQASKQIIVIGSLNPTKECQDRVRVFSIQGISPAIRATDYKDPPKIVSK